MTKPTVDQIADMAEGACFYVTPEGQWLRMQYCDMDEGTFTAMDEESGEDYCITFDEITLEGLEAFHKIVKMTVPAQGV